jgi:oxygen-independent coproporphyrinogen-3 oxidase
VSHPGVGEPHEAFGVYVHVPFCAARCDYCAFATWTDRDQLMGQYVTACLAEVEAAWSQEDLPPATSVFVGGGTPSRLPPELFAMLLEGIPRQPGAEVTVECNPEDASEQRFACWQEAGVNRVSFGVQSMLPHVLFGLGRRHTPGSVDRALSLASSAGFSTMNVDLIFGGAGEREEDWLATLRTIVGMPLPAPHVSCYALTVEPGTPLAADPDRHPDDDDQARRYLYAEEILGAAGYHCYEVSNWAKPGHECRHNRLYWEQGDYRGIGCSAHSHRSGRRWWNVRTPERYIAALASGSSPVGAEETLTAEQRVFEGLALSLRTDRGVPVSVVPEDLVLDGLVEQVGDRAVLTVQGRLLANEVTVRLGVPADPDILRG